MMRTDCELHTFNGNYYFMVVLSHPHINPKTMAYGFETQRCGRGFKSRKLEWTLSGLKLDSVVGI